MSSQFFLARKSSKLQTTSTVLLALESAVATTRSLLHRAKATIRRNGHGFSHAATIKKIKGLEPLR
jgi:hypothetical protein